VSEPDDASAARSDARGRAYWRSNLRILAILLGLWAVAGFGLGIVAVPWLDRFHVAGFPLGFWFGQQGSILIFVALIAVYAVWMDRVERRMQREQARHE
jgi:putative solute:sodium symporter small subunit